MSKELELRPLEELKKALPELTAILSLNAAEGVDVNTLALQELDNLRMISVTKPEILECFASTVVMAVKRVLKQNLTLDPYAGLVYVKTRNVTIKQKNEDGNITEKKGKALEIMESCNGLLSINYQCKKIIDHKTPTVKKDAAGKVESVTFEYQLSSGRWEERTFDESDFYRWRRASHKENGRWKDDFNTPQATESLKYANENYINWKGGIDPEFARAKAIRHALKKLGTNPNEGKFNKIIIPAEKKVIIEEGKDELATTDGEAIQDAVVISSTTNEPAIQPNNSFTAATPSGL